MLSLVFVETLYLNVENTVCIEDDARSALDVFCKGFLVFLLYCHELCEDFLVVLELAEILKLCAVLDELGTDGVLQQLCKSGIGLIEPSSVSDSVGDVLELLGSILIFIMEYGVLDYLRVELGNAVYAV